MDYFVDTVNQWLAPELRSEVMTLAQEFEQHGIKLGIKLGIELGIERSIMAYRLLTDGMSVEEVANLTKLSLEIVKKIQMETQNDN